MADFNLGDYRTVAERYAEFRDKHPEGSTQPWNPDKPYEVITVGDRLFVVCVEAAYRTPDDPRPGVGIAWEPFPGKTNYTRESELMNAQTGAQGRALVAVLAADTKKGIASQEEVRNRRAEQTQAQVTATTPMPTPAMLRAKIAHASDLTPDEIAADFASWSTGETIGTAGAALLTEYLDTLGGR